MVRRGQRKLKSKAMRAMMSWNTCQFRVLLQQVALKYTDRHVVIVDEHHTSKTCGVCGLLHQKLAHAKVFRCPSCQFTWDRDYNELAIFSCS